MLTSKDFMIGDWVNVTGEENCLPLEILKLLPKIGRVVGLDGDTIYVDFVDFGFMLGDVRPIPLTNEILWKNLPDPEIVCWYPDNNTYRIGIGDNVALNIKYVQELQHALRLCGIEKEIEI